MSARKTRIDKPLLFLIALLVVVGLIIFASAIFGPLARGASNVSSVAFRHLVFGVGAGLVGLVLATFINYRTWRRFAPHLYILALVATALVFVPSLGFEHGGGKRWLDLGVLTFQPSEALKLACVMLAAAYFSMLRTRMDESLYSLGGLFAILALPVVLLILQPDLGTLGLITLSVFAVFLAAGARFRDILGTALIGLLLLGSLVFLMPHARDRVATFLDPSRAPQAEGYQIKQSLIAIGSGGLTGRGFGQSIQKFTYLPEPMGDSIFAIAGEEFGFIGTVSIVGLFLAFALRSFAIASRAADSFGGLLAIGIASYLSIEAFINIAAMLGLAPLTGIPLTFISQGGSAMLVSLFAAGILLNISKYAR